MLALCRKKALIRQFIKKFLLLIVKHTFELLWWVFFSRLVEFEELTSRNAKLSDYLKQKDDKIVRLQERWDNWFKTGESIARS